MGDITKDNGTPSSGDNRWMIHVHPLDGVWSVIAGRPLSITGCFVVCVCADWRQITERDVVESVISLEIDAYHSLA